MYYKKRLLSKLMLLFEESLVFCKTKMLSNLMLFEEDLVLQEIMLSTLRLVEENLVLQKKVVIKTNAIW